MPQLKGGIKQMEQVFAKIAIAVRLTSASGSVPDNRTMISEAHHSEIIRKLGTASFRKGDHLVKADREKPCQDLSNSLRRARQVLKTIHEARIALLRDVATAAPMKPSFRGWTRAQQRGR
mmetsp:Transcript_27542/g.56790  ORF Transcript_27542/g.56790 Transcript_27542/m.56790 type:complete len:120 (-) Transcript_27542:147-506(-)